MLIILSIRVISNFGLMNLFFGIMNLVRIKIFRKTNISYPLIRTRKCAYQEVRIISFSENFSYAK